MEIWVPKSGKSFSKESIEEVWEAWRNDSSKDECKVQLDGPKSGGQARKWAFYGLTGLMGMSRHPTAQ